MIGKTDKKARWPFIGLFVLLLAGGAALITDLFFRPAGAGQVALTPGGPTGQPTRLIAIDYPTLTAIPSPTATDTPRPTATPTSRPVDYGPMESALIRYLEQTAYAQGYDVGIAFVDLKTGQEISIGGDQRYYALSTFKGPLGVYYLWLLERELIQAQPGDEDYLTLMLNQSSNSATTCVFKRVGGIAPFNDWLAEQGLSRQNNFVFKWSDWACFADGDIYKPEPDWRYSQGDDQLGLPGGGVLFQCPTEAIPCDKAFTPTALARFYARVYRGELLTPEDTTLWLSWMEKQRDNSALVADTPGQASVRAFVKDGFRQADALYYHNFYHEAGIIQTERGAFVLAVFMQRNPVYPGTDNLADIGRIVYEYFENVHFLSVP
jgi:hypothetical protein